MGFQREDSLYWRFESNQPRLWVSWHRLRSATSNQGGKNDDDARAGSQSKRPAQHTFHAQPTYRTRQHHADEHKCR